jgi:CHAT domain-containing protein/tetratricopeptide (TPR) repeat protein
MTRIAVTRAALVVAIVCFPFIGSGQTEEEGTALFNEAKQMWEKWRELPHGELKDKGEQELICKFEEAEAVLEKANAGKMQISALSWIASFQKDDRKRLQYHERILAIYRKLGDASGEAGALTTIGYYYSCLSEPQQALKHFEESLAVARKHGLRKDEAGTLTSIGNFYERLKKPEKKKEYVQRALKIYLSLADQRDDPEVLSAIAHRYEDLSNTLKYHEYMAKAALSYRRLGNLESEAGVLDHLGSSYRREKKHQQALASAERCVEIFRQLGDRSKECYALEDMASTYEDWCEHARSHTYCDKGLEYYDKALAIAAKNGDTRREIDLLRSVALKFDMPEVPRFRERARQARERGLKLAESIGDVEKLRDRLDEEFLMWRWFKWHAAFDAAHKWVALERRTGDRSKEADALQKISWLHLMQGEYQQALDYCEKGLEVGKNAGTPSDQWSSRAYMAEIYTELGQHQRALDLYEGALGDCIKTKGVEKCHGNLQGLGYLYARAGQPRKALECHRRRLEVINKALERERGANASDRRAYLTYKCQSLEAAGQVYRQMGQYDKALDAYREALKIATEHDSYSTSALRSAIAEVYLDMGQAAKAEQVLVMAKKQDANGEGTGMISGRLHLMKGDHAKARDYYLHEIEVAKRMRFSVQVFGAYTGAGLAFETMGDHSGAAEHFRKAMEQVEEQRSLLNPAEREHFFGAEVEGYLRTTPYEGLARVLVRLNKLPEAFKISEYTKARLFSEAMARSAQGQRFDVPAEVIRTGSGISDKLAAVKKQRAQAVEQTPEAVPALEEEIKSLEAKRSAHMKMLRENYPLFAATKYPEPMELSQTALAPNERVLAYDVTDTGIIIYLTEGKKVVKALFKPIVRKELDELVRSFRQSLEVGADEPVVQKLSAFDFRAGKQLSDILLSDILPNLPKGAAVIIVPDDSLGVLPFEMLVLNAGGKIATDKRVPYVTGAEFFGDRNPISYYQSVTALTLFRTLGKRHRAGDKALAMVDPIFSEEDSRLERMVKDEKSQLLMNLPRDLLMSIQGERGLTFPRLPLTAQLGASLKKADPSATDLFAGLDAKKAALFERDLTAYRSVVFATHGYFGKDLPGIQEPVLVLSLLDQPKGQDGFLRLSEVMGLKINCDMAALTACQTGLGRHISGEGTMGMGRAFQYAGARSVLMSLWSVAESSSINLVESFFKHVRAGKNKLEALKLARDEVRAAGYDHPFFWAPFILVGEVN